MAVRWGVIIQGQFELTVDNYIKTMSRDLQRYHDAVPKTFRCVVVQMGALWVTSKQKLADTFVSGVHLGGRLCGRLAARVVSALKVRHGFVVAWVHNHLNSLVLQVSGTSVSCSSASWLTFVSWLKYASVVSLCWCIMEARVDGLPGWLCLISSGVRTREPTTWV